MYTLKIRNANIHWFVLYCIGICHEPCHCTIAWSLYKVQTNYNEASADLRICHDALLVHFCTSNCFPAFNVNVRKVRFLYFQLQWQHKSVHFQRRTIFLRALININEDPQNFNLTISYHHFIIPQDFVHNCHKIIDYESLHRRYATAPHALHSLSHQSW